MEPPNWLCSSRTLPAPAYSLVQTGLTRFRSPTSRTIAAFRVYSVVSHDPTHPTIHPSCLARSAGRQTTRTFAAFQGLANSLTVPIQEVVTIPRSDSQPDFRGVSVTSLLSHGLDLSGRVSVDHKSFASNDSVHREEESAKRERDRKWRWKLVILWRTTTSLKGHWTSHREKRRVRNVRHIVGVTQGGIRMEWRWLHAY